MFLIITDEVFWGCDDIFFLNSIAVLCTDATGQERIFGERFKSSPTYRCSLDIHSGPKEYMNAFSLGFLSE